jgi:hypothetical protein
MLQSSFRWIPGSSRLAASFSRSLRGALAIVALCHCVGSSELRAQDVLVVSPTPGPGIDYTILSVAVDAAAPGSIILVKTGFYNSIVIEDKGISIVAEAGASVKLSQAFIRVRGLPAGQTVLLRGLQVQTGPDFEAEWTYPALLVENCEGTVWVEDCKLLEGDPAIQVNNPRTSGSGVVVLRSELTGVPTIDQIFFINPGGAALQLIAGSAHFYDCTLTGGRGQDGHCCFPSVPSYPGTVGADLAGGSALFVRSTFTGGQGGNGTKNNQLPPSCFGPGSGGDGLHLGAGAVLRHLQTTITGGPPGVPDFGCPLGVSGVALKDLGGVIEALDGVAPGSSGSSPVREGEAVSVTIDGQPGAAVLLAVSTGEHAQYIVGLSGALLVEFPATLLALGTMPAGGTLVLADVVPSLPPGIEGLTVFVQPATVTAPGECVLGGAAAFTLLDDTL